MVAHAINPGFPGDVTPLARLLSAELDGARVWVENDLDAAAMDTRGAFGAPGRPSRRLVPPRWAVGRWRNGGHHRDA